MGQFHPLTQEFLDNIPEKKLSIPYCKESPLQIMDVYFPPVLQSTPRPVLIHTHGGAFANGNQREDNAEPMISAIHRGYVVASIQYRGAKTAFFPAQLYDCKAAVRFLRAHAVEWNLDAKHFAAWGPSSGGWLASMLGVTGDNPAFEDRSQGNGEYSSAVQAVIDWCGPCGGFLEMDRAFRKSGLGDPNHDSPQSPESKFMGRTITEIPELVKLACPISYVNPAMPPFCIFHGTADQVVPVEQSVAFAAAITEAAGADKVELHLVTGITHHGDPQYQQPWIANECLDFLDRVFKK